MKPHPLKWENFLKCLALCSENIITKKELKFLVGDILGEDEKLFGWFSTFVGVSEDVKYPKQEIPSPYTHIPPSSPPTKHSPSPLGQGTSAGDSSGETTQEPGEESMKEESTGYRLATTVTIPIHKETQHLKESSEMPKISTDITSNSENASATSSEVTPTCLETVPKSPLVSVLGSEEIDVQTLQQTESEIQHTPQPNICE